MTCMHSDGVDNRALQARMGIGTRRSITIDFDTHITNSERVHQFINFMKVPKIGMLFSKMKRLAIVSLLC